ncbi:MAG: hypothetical protein MJ138_07330, partial [Kiritimatiellae bacterium]|nr:hypothetical protein [Kiritimatiellia bacterium]
GGAMAYINGSTRASYGPQYLFDADETTTASRWDPKGTTPYYAQYVFKPNGVETRRSVTGIGLNSHKPTSNQNRALYGFDFQGSNDGTDWTTLLSVSQLDPIVSGTWDFPNSETFSRYRFVVTKAESQLEMYNLAFYSYRDDDVLEIRGSPAYGTPDPDYGVHVGLAQGQEMTLTAPSAEIDVSEDEKSVCTGYALAVDGAETVYGAGTSCAYVHAGKGTALTWLFASAYRQRVAVVGSGTVDCAAESFVAAGTALTITATPDDGCSFLEWRGDVPKGQSQNPSLVFTVDGPRSLTAVFSSPVHVSATGDDANDGTSWAKAVRTVARGWELCGGVGRMLVGEGEFSVRPGLLAVTGNLQIEGRGPGKTVLVADNSESTGTLLAVGHERAMVAGVCVKGARQETGPGAGLVLTAGVVTNCCFDSCTTSTRGGGVWLNGTGTLVDSVVTNCTATVTGGGVYFTAGTFRSNLVTCCSAPDGGGAYFAEAATVSDSAFCGNKASSKGGALACEAKDVFFTNCVFEANVAVDDSGVINSCPGSVVFEDCLFSGNKSTTRRSGVGMHFGGVIRRSRLVGNGSNDSTFGGVLYLEGTSLLANCLVANTVGGKGAIYGIGGAIVNCTVVSNRCNAGGAMWSTGGEVHNTIFACNVTGGGAVVSNWTDSAANAKNCCIEAHDPTVLGEGSISKDPRFADAANGDYALAKRSPCVNAGDNAQVAAGDRDLGGNPRIRAFGGRAKHDVVDMGCYESPWRRTTGSLVLVQ